jgi:hypothetical protein
LSQITSLGGRATNEASADEARLALANCTMTVSRAHPARPCKVDRDCDCCQADYAAWRLWMADVMDAETKTTWYSWNKRELEKVCANSSYVAARRQYQCTHVETSV